MWTSFDDMHSGGGLKESPYRTIYIEAPIEDAKIVFYNKFGHNPERVSCTCCGDDYSISEDKSLQQATGFERGCMSLKTPQNQKTGLYIKMPQKFHDNYYVEDGEKPIDGYELSENGYQSREYQTLDQYIKKETVLVIKEEEISPEWKKGKVPEQGYVWKD